MAGKLAILAVLPALAFLILWKSDQQSVRALEGKLYRQGRELSAAEPVYVRNKQPLATLLFVTGLPIAVAGIILFETNVVGLGVAAFGAACMMLGVISRIRSLSQSYRELT